MEEKETFTRTEVVRMLKTLEKLVRERDWSFDAVTETVITDSGGFIMDGLVDY